MLLPLLRLNDAVAPPATIAAGSLVGGAPLGSVPLAGARVQTVAVSGVATVATSQGQTVAATTALTINATASSSQGQSVSATATGTLASSATTSQGQSVSATTALTIASSAATAQGQTVAATAQNSLSATLGTAQGQSVAATGSAGGASVDATVSTSQAQSVNATAEQALAAVFNGGFDMSRKVYIKRGKKYLIFNDNQEADSYLAAEKAIESARKSSRGAVKRVIKALKVVKPEIKAAPKLEELETLLAKFDVKFDITKNIGNIDSLYHIQSMLHALQQDEDDIELLLLAI